MTWLSYSTRALSLFGVLPLVLKKLSPGDIVLWYLFATIMSLQAIADFGFRQTFSRLISYAFVGVEDVMIFNQNTSPKYSINLAVPNIELLWRLISSMKHIYKWLTLIIAVLMLWLGTWSLILPIKNASNGTNAWFSWSIVVVVFCVSFYGKIYMNYLEGLFKVALVRRVETLTSLGIILTSITVLLVAPSLLNLVFANQIWVLINVYRDWYLCQKVENGLYKRVSVLQRFDKPFFEKVWHPAWRSGLSGFMSVGLTNLTGLIYAQIGESTDVASYLLALRIINQIKDISMAPFYSKLPLMAMLRVKNDISNLTQVARRGMFLSHLAFIIGVVSVAVSSSYLMRILHSHVPFVSTELWLLLGIAFFIHRFGAMHIQLYMTTNHIISHIADGVSGMLYIISAICLAKYIGLYAIPIGMLIGYLGFYSWYAAFYSYRSLLITAWKFEKYVIFLSVTLIFVYVIIKVGGFL